MTTTTLNNSRLAAAAAVLLITINAPVFGANAVKNGDFSQIGLNGNPAVSNQPGKQEVESAARYWDQAKLVDGSTITTQVEPIGFNGNKLHVITNAGPLPNLPVGNGVYQPFAPINCAKASFWYNVTSGEFTGSLVYQGANWVSTPKFQTTNGAWKLYMQFVSSTTPVSQIDFESLSPPTHNLPIDYSLMNVQVQPCPAGVLVPVKDLSQYLAYDPFYYLKNPGGPVEKIRITNHGTATLTGPFYLLLEGLTAGRSLINPDGSYLSTQFVTLTSRTLAPGQSEVVTLQFDADPAGIVPEFRPKLVSGIFQ